MSPRYRHLWTQGDLEPQLETLVPQLAPWIHAASNPFADWYFGGAEVAGEIIQEWMARPSSEMFLGRAFLLHDGDAAGSAAPPAGCLIGVSGAELTALRAADFAAFCQDLGTGPEAERVIEDVVAAARELFPPVGADQYLVSRVAVDPRRRGQGLGRALVAHAVETKRTEGFRRFRLDVAADNASAIRAYQAVGFAITSTSRHAPSGLAYCAMTLNAG
jgi:ribosomal protein S18 acetylase RimI-like enzyme